MIENLELKDVLPSISSFIIGILGISIQIKLLFDSKKKDRKNNLYQNSLNVYTPLLMKLKEYKINKDYLAKLDENFTVIKKPTTNKNEEQNVYQKLMLNYHEIKSILTNKYIPLDGEKRLNCEIYKIMDHVYKVILLNENKGISEDYKNSLISNEELQGYNVELLIKLLTDITIK